MTNDQWPEVVLGDYCDRVTVGHVGPMADRYVASGIPFLRSQDIAPFSLLTNAVKFIDQDFDGQLRKSRLRPGDVAIVRTGYPGTAAVVPRDFGPANCADLVILTPGPKLDAWFVASLFNSSWGRGQVGGVLVGVAQQHFNVGAAKGMRVRLPPLEVQRRIGAIVRAYSDLIELNRRRISILDEMARRSFEEWFVRFSYPGSEATKCPVGTLPPDWQALPVSALAHVRRGRSYKSSELGEEDGVPFVNLKCIQRDGGFRLDGLKLFVGEAKAHHFVERGDIVIAVTDMTQERRIVAQAARIPLLSHPAVFSMDLVKLEVEDVAIRNYLYAYWRWSGCALELRHHANGANVLHLAAERISNHLLPVPPGDLIQQFWRRVAPLLELGEVLAQQNERLFTARDVMLPKLLSGDIQVRAAERTLEDAA